MFSFSFEFSLFFLLTHILYARLFVYLFIFRKQFVISYVILLLKQIYLDIRMFRNLYWITRERRKKKFKCRDQNIKTVKIYFLIWVFPYITDDKPWKQYLPKNYLLSVLLFVTFITQRCIARCFASGMRSMVLKAPHLSLSQKQKKIFEVWSNMRVSIECFWVNFCFTTNLS